MKKNILSICFLLLARMLFAGDPIEKSAITITGNKPASLKTSNGCWDVNHFVINRGDSVLNIPATIGYTVNSDYFPADTLPTNHLLDFSFPNDLSWLDGSSGDRYFAVATSDYIYLYSTKPQLSFYEAPSIQRIDSLVTPSEFVSIYVHDLSELLVVNKYDSTRYAYSFYDIPQLALDTQILLSIRPEKIIPDYLIVGTDSSNSSFTTIQTSDHQIVKQIILPSEAHNTKVITHATSNFYFLSTPGDTTTFLVKLHEADTAFTVTPLLPNSGINASAIYDNGDLIFQSEEDTSSNELHKKLLLVDPQSSAITTTFALNKRVSSLHYKPQLFGTSAYTIFGTQSANPSDWVFLHYDNTQWTELDSFQAGANPSWFAEDFRCYVGIEEIEKNLAIIVYPNPASEQVHIQVTGLAKGKTYLFEIFDESGKSLWKESILSKQEYSIPLQSFPKGLLFLKVDAGSKSVTKRIVKM